MSGGKKLTVVTVILFVAIAVSCMTVSRCCGPGSLRFVDGGKSRPGRAAGQGIVVVTHGWIDKSRGSWPEDMAAEIHKRVDPNDWLCGYFDWSDGAKTFNATKAARYARDTAGPNLAKEIIKVGGRARHIHLLGHSSGCWAVSEAAKILAQETEADLHLTFFDAYVSAFWDQKRLGDVNVPAGRRYWADHYYTRDYTLGWTQYDLTHAHNVDVTEVDQHLKDHKFPWKWYHATVTGKYPEGYFLDDRKLVSTVGGVEYGFAHSRESGEANNWKASLRLPMGNKAVKLRKKTETDSVTGLQSYLHR